MDPLRKLLVLGMNELLSRELISLEGRVTPNRDDGGHVFADVAGQPSVIMWSDIGFQELRITVWWKYDHQLHPQAELQDKFRESFSGSTPLADRSEYSDFVAACASGWLERKEGKYLQGKGRDCVFDTYVRRGTLDELKRMPDPTALGYQAEGKFHM